MIKKCFIIKGYYCVLLVLLTGTISCSRNFLNAPKPGSGELDTKVLFTTEKGAHTALTGIYSLLRDHLNETEGQFNANNCGLKNVYDLNFDVKGNDIIADPSDWWLDEDQWLQNDYDRMGITWMGRSANMWDIFYKTINNANNIIVQVPNLPASETVKNALIGEAKALRAFAYFNLARAYQFTYAKDPHAKGVPVYLMPASPESGGNPRAPLIEVYALIVSDLEFAQTHVPEQVGADKFRINNKVVHGIAARVYQELAMHDNNLWDKAIMHARQARAGVPLMPATEYVKGFNDRNNPEWIWCQPFNATQSLGNVSIFAFIDMSGGVKRYNNLYINTAFVSRFSATDVRNQFIPATDQSVAAPWKKFVSLKFRDKPDLSGDYILMRAAEMLLIEVEGLAHRNQLEVAKDSLYALQLIRDPLAVRSDAVTPAAFIEEVLMERRKELYGEVGVEYFDLKRYQRPFIAEGNAYLPLSIAAQDKRWLYRIPQRELDVNVNIPVSEQNP